MNLSQACSFATLVSLAPIILYIFGFIKDPFNPLLVIAGIAFGDCVLKPLTNPAPALAYVPEYALIQIEELVAVSLLALYAGWLAWRLRNHQPRIPVLDASQALALYRRQYFAHHFLIIGWILTVIAVPTWFLLGPRSTTATGYLTWMADLRFPGAILVIQSAVLNRRYLAPCVICVILASVPNIVFFFTYGGRADTAQLVVLICVAYLMWQKRPWKGYILIFGILFAIVLGTIADSRALPNSDTITGRIDALYTVGKNFVTNRKIEYDSGAEFVVGADQIAVLDKRHNWDDGKFLWNMGVLLLPKEYYPNKDNYYSQWYTTNYLQIINDNLDVPQLVGAAPTGFANVLVEFGWLFPLVWFALGYWLRSLYSKSVYSARLDLQGCFVILIIALLFLIAQDIYAYLREIIFNLIPIYFVYKLCRVPSKQTQPTAAIGIPAHR
ncbi:MAG TPA: hypothetical protein VMG59_06585 [Phycisphaerae bacterium]|nr:hypothetical protein [Phycisphaerae bacterium]